MLSTIRHQMRAPAKPWCSPGLHTQGYLQAASAVLDTSDSLSATCRQWAVMQMHKCWCKTLETSSTMGHLLALYKTGPTNFGRSKIVANTSRGWHTMELTTLPWAVVYPCVCSSASANMIWVMPSRHEKLNTTCNHSFCCLENRRMAIWPTACLRLQPKSDALGEGQGKQIQIIISQALSQPLPAGLLIEDTNAAGSHGSDGLCDCMQALKLKTGFYTVISFIQKSSCGLCDVLKLQQAEAS